jgi:hypothetical protein
LARSKSKHRRVQMKIRQRWKKRLERKKAAAPPAAKAKK